MLEDKVTCKCGIEASGADIPDYFYADETGWLQPCKLCRCDTASVYYYNNHEAVREAQNKRYQADLEKSRAYFREKRRQQRAAARLQTA